VKTAASGAELELPPDASRTIEGLRDTGYDFRSAVADIIDNSIAARATKVAVRVVLTPDGPEVSVADNGSGMDGEGLINAMKYGSRMRPSPISLGKFGLGLKTASTSVCRQLTVVTRAAKGGSNAAQWDLDYVAEQNKWLLRRPAVLPSDAELLDHVTGGGSGTIVIWRKVDRLLPTNYKRNKAAQNALDRTVETLRQHLAITYVRFLAKNSGHDQVEITINDKRVHGWDPFGIELGSEQLLDEQVPVEVDGEPATFRLRAYALPPRSELGPDALKVADLTTDKQGFYVFREDRVISYGSWLGLFQIEPHSNLCRIDFSFDHKLDAALHLDLKKSRIEMLADLQTYVRKVIAPARAEAQERYRKNERTEITKEGPGLHATSNSILSHTADGLSRSEVTVVGPDQAKVSNPHGSVIITIPTLDQKSAGGPFVVAVPEMEDGILWRPGLVSGKKAVLLNVGHPYYQRVYLAAGLQPVAVQGMNFLLWSLCEAELGAITEDERDTMRAIRREVSRIVRELAKELPEHEEPAPDASLEA